MEVIMKIQENIYNIAPSYVQLRSRTCAESPSCKYI